MSDGGHGYRSGDRRLVGLLLAAAIAIGAVAGCASGPAPSGPADSGQGTSIVVTYSVLGSVVKDLVGDAATVTVLVPNGADPHEWSPSARDIEALMKADLIVENGLGLEGGLTSAFDQAEKAGVNRFVASDHIVVRTVGAGEGTDPAQLDQAPGAQDPHLWMDPLAMKDVVVALAPELKADLGIDVSARAADLGSRLDQLNDRLDGILSVVPATDRKLVTGHESLGYFAERYGFTLIGAIVPSLTSQAESSSAALAALTATIAAEHVKAIFTELGTSPAVADAVGKETGAKVVELATHTLPPDGSYFTFMADMATLIADTLK
jgi:zinc/manganese transport system substrate-binding protein